MVVEQDAEEWRSSRPSGYMGQPPDIPLHPTRSKNAIAALSTLVAFRAANSSPDRKELKNVADMLVAAVVAQHVVERKGGDRVLLRYQLAKAFCPTILMAANAVDKTSAVRGMVHDMWLQWYYASAVAPRFKLDMKVLCPFTKEGIEQAELAAEQAACGKSTDVVVLDQ